MLGFRQQFFQGISEFVLDFWLLSWLREIISRRMVVFEPFRYQLHASPAKQTFACVVQNELLNSFPNLQVWKRGASTAPVKKSTR